MSDLKQIAFNRGMAMLQASGAIFAVWHNGAPTTSASTKFALVGPDQIVRGDLAIAHKPRAKLTKPRQSWLHTGYSEALKQLKPGELWEYQCCGKEEGIGLQKAVTGAAAKLFGPDKYLSTVDYVTLKFELLRVE